MKTSYKVILYFLAILSLLAELGTRSAAAGHWWGSVPGFFLIFGFAGCVAIILISKALGKKFLQRKEDYYDAD